MPPKAPPKSAAAKSTPAVAKPAPKPVPSEPVDPRLALAQKYMTSATAHVAEKEKELPRSRRAGGAGRKSAAFSFSIAPATFVHILLSAIVLTFCACAWVWAIALMNHAASFVAGRIVATSAGFPTAAALGYFSICYLGVIESTAGGRTEVDILQGDWRDWFWTLPMTLGMAAVAAGVGWVLSLVLPINVWVLVGLCLFAFYPLLQLSALETGTPLAPLSVVVARSLVKHPFAWLLLYGVSFAVVQVLLLIGFTILKDPTEAAVWTTILLLGPLVTVALFFYAWLLGQLAHLISTGKDS